MAVTNSEIYECTYHIMTIEDCGKVLFDNCLFRDNGEFNMVNILRSSDISIINSEFRDNSVYMGSRLDYFFFSVSSSENISIKNTAFISNSAPSLGNTKGTVFENCVFDSNSWD